MASPYDNPDPYARHFDEGGSTGAPTTPDVSTIAPGLLQTGLLQQMPPGYGGFASHEAMKRAQQEADASRTAFAEHSKQIEAQEGKQQMTVDQMSKLLDDTAATIRRSRSGEMNLPLMALGAGMMSGTGGIGQQIGAGLQQMIPTIQAQRQRGDETELALARLGLQKGQIEMMPQQEKIKYLQALAQGDLATARQYELGMLRSAPAMEKANQPKSLGQGMIWDPTTGKIQRNGLLGLTDVGQIGARTNALGASLGSTFTGGQGDVQINRGSEDKAIGTDKSPYNESVYEQLKQINPGVAEMVRALARGEKQFPGDRGKFSQDQADLLNLVKAYDPSFNTMDYNARAKTLQSFTSGDDAKSISALRLAISHMGELHTAAGQLGNTDFQSINALKNWAKTQFGSSDVTNFAAIAHPVAEEISRVFKGGNLSDSEIKEWQKSLSPNMSPEQIQGAMDKLQHMLNARLGTLEEKYQQGMGRPSQGHDILGQQAREKLKEMEDHPLPGSNKAKAAQAGVTGGGGGGGGGSRDGEIRQNAKGERVQLRNGKWERM